MGSVKAPRRRVALGVLVPSLCAAVLGLLVLRPACAEDSGGVRRVELARFANVQPGNSLPAAWVHQTLPSVERANRFDIVKDGGVSVLRVISDRSASSLLAVQRVDLAATPLLRWRWRVSRPVSASDLRRKAGDDYAARVYVLFDLPSERLSVGDRMKMMTARLLYGSDLPAAALCYVWGTAQSVGESGWNAYSDRLRMIVVDSGATHAGQWREVVRDVAADFRAAFGDPLMPVTGVALGADTDNTGERVEARFADP